MRSGDISNDMWRLYLSRVLQPSDPRLHMPPFDTSPVQYIVHRHRVRVRQSFKNAVEHCRKNALRIYVCKASVEAKAGEEHLLTPSVCAELLHLANQRQTGFVESILPLYIGMRLLLFSKDCVRFGLMKGCECVLEQIIFDELEVLPQHVVAGEPIHLEYVPFSLLLRATNAPWSLRAENLPPLPLTADRRGLFQLKATSTYIRRKVAANEFATFKRA